MRSKKAQVTIYIIIGIIIVSAAAFFFYLTQQQAEKGFITPVTEETPLEFQPLQSFVDFCIIKTSTEGLKILGEQGGYITPLDYGVIAGNDPTASTGVNLLSQTLPYWHYLSSKNDCSEDCIFSSKRPNLFKDQGEPSIEGQLSEYINNNLRTCLDDFNIFKEQGYEIKENSEIRTNVAVAEKDMPIVVKYDVEATIEGSTTKLEEFFVRIPIDMKKIYSLANSISSLETQYGYLEKHTLNLIGGFSGLDREIPPRFDMNFEFGGGKTWSKQKVKQNIQEMLEVYTQLFQVSNTLNYQYRYLEDESKSALYNRGTLIPIQTLNNNLKASFAYYQPDLGWPIYFDLNCNGDLCQSESISSNLAALIGIQRYNFLYDISYPVLVEINSPYELSQYFPEGYTFRFFLESNIRDNEPLSPEYEKLESYDIETGSMLCDQNKRNTGNITVSVKDSMTKEDLDDVKVAYKCGDESCIVGSTTDGKLTAQFPVCLGGIISYMKQDYLSYSEILSTEIDKLDTTSISLAPLITRPITVMKKKIDKNMNWQLVNAPIEMTDKEEAIITMTRKGDIQDQDYSTVAGYTGNQTGPSEIQLAPGNYDLNIQLILYDDVLVDDEVCYKVLLKEKCESIKFAMNNTPAGGLNLNIDITPEDLKKDSITFFTIDLDPKEQFTKIDGLNQLNLIKNNSQLYRPLLLPEIR